MQIWRSGDAWLSAVVVLGAVLRLFPIWFGQSYANARPDEEVAVVKAAAILAGDPNPHFFHWPSLTLYVFAGLFAGASWIADTLGADSTIGNHGYTLIGRAFVALAGTATILVLFKMVRQVTDRATGLAAASFLAVALLHVRDSHFAITDVLMTLLVTISLSVLVDVVTRDTGRHPADRTMLKTMGAAGLMGGLAASTKYSAAAVLASMAVIQILVFASEPVRLRSIASWAPSIVFAAAFAFGFVAGTPYALLDFAAFKEGVQFDVIHLSGGHGVDLGSGWTYHLTHSLPYGVGMPVFVAGLFGIVPFVRNYRQSSAVLGGFAVALYLSLGTGRTVFFRYVLPLVPIVCLLAAVGVRHVSTWIGVRARIPVRPIMAAIAALVMIPSLVSSVWFDVLLARADTRVLAARWLERRLQPEDSLHDAGGPYTRLDLSRVRFHEWPFDRRANTFGHPDGKTPEWLVLHESPLRLYASIPWELRQLAGARYALAASFPATQGRARSAVYDHQDAFFMPFSGFRTVLRPGPTISIYRRLDAPFTRVKTR